MFVDLLQLVTSLSVVVHTVVVVALAVRVIMRRSATGVALAWLVVILALPLAGAVLYLLVGERRIGRARAEGIESLRLDNRLIVEAAMKEGLTDVDWSRHSSAATSLGRLGETMVGSPTLHGSRFDILSETPEILQAIARDVDGASKSVLMEFYIWNEGGLADEVLEAVMRAARRGVACCLLIDALGARPWWKGQQPQRLRAAGVEVRPALPVGLFRTLIGRTDLRLHRKIVIIDGHIAWTGSMNLVDPRFFKQEANVGEWVDAMTRLEGAVVVGLAATMIGDWNLETAEPLRELVARFGLRLVEPVGTADMQVISSGPGQTGDALLQMVLTLINGSRRELVLTTPYLVPDDSLLRALRGAASRGVDVKLIVPEKVDSLLTRFASLSYYDDLLEVGITILLYRGGLLHTKSIVADREIAMFGTVNLDLRSFWLNYEVALFVYDREFSTELRKLLSAYEADSDTLDPQQWSERSFRHRLMENTLRLASPLL